MRDIKHSTADAISAFFKKISNSKEIQIQYNTFGKIKLSETDVDTLINGLRTHKNIVSLTISTLSLTPNNVQTICELLKNNNHITKLCLNFTFSRLSSSDIEIAVSYIAEMLLINRTLIELHLTNNAIGDDGVTLLSNALKNNHHLHELNLTNNAIGEDGGKTLLEMLQQNQTIRVLNVDNNSSIGNTLLDDLEKERSPLSSLLRILDAIPSNNPVLEKFPVLENLKAELKKLQTEVHEHTREIEILGEKHNEIRIIIDQLKKSIEEGNKQHQEQMILLEKKLESKIETAEDQINTILAEQEKSEKTYSTLYQHYNDHDVKLRELKQELKDLQQSSITQEEKNTQRITVIESEISEQELEIKNLEGSITEVQKTQDRFKRTLSNLLIGENFGEQLKTFRMREIAQATRIDNLEKTLTQFQETKSTSQKTQPSQMRERALIAKDKELYEFYLNTLAELGNLLLAIIVLKSRRVNAQPDAVTNFVSTAITDIPVPGINTLVGGVNLVLDKRGESKQKKQLNPLQYFKFNDIDEIADGVACELTAQYEEQIRELTSKGVIQMSLAFINRVMALSNQPSSFLNLEPGNVIAFKIYLLSATIATPENLGMISKDTLETKEKSRKWKEGSIFRKPGIKILQDTKTEENRYRFYSSDSKQTTKKSKLRPDKYGYRLLASNQELERFRQDLNCELKEDQKRVEAEKKLSSVSIRESIYFN